MIMLSHISHMLTVMVTSHKVTEKDIEGFGRIISYNVYNTG